MRLHEALSKDRISINDLRRIALNDPRNEKERKIRWVLFGVYYGYSKESISEFLSFGSSGYDGEFDGSGFIPSRRERNMDPQEVVKKINKRRFSPDKFNLDKNIQSYADYVETSSRDALRISNLLTTNKRFIDSVKKIAMMSGFHVA